MKTRFCLTVLFLLVSQASFSQSKAFKWQPNDISIAFPLPGKEAKDGLLPLTVQTKTRTVELLPRAVFQMLGDKSVSDLPFIFEAPGREKAYDHIRIVSVRIDPCFDNLNPKKNPKECTHLIRLVGQVFSPAGESGPEWTDVSDAAVHLFYKLSDAEFVTLLNGLKALRSASAIESPLGVHPVMQKEGLAGPFAQNLKSLLLNFTDASHLMRMTFMATGRNGTNWFWGKIDKAADGKFTVSQIPPQMERHLDDFTQESPSNAIDDSLAIPNFPMPFRSNNSISQMSDQDLQAGVDLLVKYENPTLTTTASINCAACHVSHVTLRYALKRKGLSAVPNSPFMFKNPKALSETQNVPLVLDRKDMHSFSYRFETLTISARARNETMATVDFMNSKEFAASLKGMTKAKAIE